MGLRSWCQKQGLSPQTVKVIKELKDVPKCTALGAKMGIEYHELTPIEESLIIENKKTLIAPIFLIVDIDGVLVSIWPALSDFWEKWKASPTSSPSQIWKELEESIIQTRPPWNSLLPLAQMAQVADQVTVWTNRFPINRDGNFWKKISSVFDDGTWLERFPFFSNQAAERLEEAKPFRGKTQVLCGLPKRISSIIQRIEEMNDPYVVYVGSSLLDIKNFKKIIKELRRREVPFDRIVFCSTNHLIL